MYYEERSENNECIDVTQKMLKALLTRTIAPHMNEAHDVLRYGALRSGRS